MPMPGCDPCCQPTTCCEGNYPSEQVVRIAGVGNNTCVTCDTEVNDDFSVSESDDCVWAGPILACFVEIAYVRYRIYESSGTWYREVIVASLEGLSPDPVFTENCGETKPDCYVEDHRIDIDSATVGRCDWTNAYIILNPTS